VTSQQSPGAAILLTGFVVPFCGAAGLHGRVGGRRKWARDVAKIEEGGGKDGEKELMEKAAGPKAL
jgi:hypothetical protein